MDENRTNEIAMMVIIWAFRYLRTEKFMRSLKTAAKDLSISDDEMFGFFLVVVTKIKKE